MGSVLSNLSTEAIIALFVAAGAVGYTLARHQPADYVASSSTGAAAPASGLAAGKKGGKKKKALTSTTAAPADTAEAEATPKPPAVVVPFPDIVPGGFNGSGAYSATPSERDDADAASSSSAPVKKAKKKKAKKAPTAVTATVSTADEQSDAPPLAMQRQEKKASASHLGVPQEPWTRVETRRSKSALKPGAEAGQSDAGVTTSVTGTSSPATVGTDDDEGAASEGPVKGGTQPRPLAERLLPKARKTGVEDMVETPDYPTVSRVMRVQPPSGEKPPAGFSWGDYEDVRAGNDADEEGDGGGWSVAKPKRTTSQLGTQPTPSASKPSSSSANAAAESKKQRQNAARRDVQKAAKAEAEAARLATLAKHKRELERTKAAEQYSATGKGARQPAKASIDENGKLVWD